jgi:hypothetical protein
VLARVNGFVPAKTFRGDSFAPFAFLRLPEFINGRMVEAMKPAPAPNVPGDTEAERMDNAVRKFLSVPKDAYLKEEERLKKLRERRKKRAKKPA